MAFGYVIAQIKVTDAATYPSYVEMVQPIIEKFGGEFIVVGVIRGCRSLVSLRRLCRRQGFAPVGLDQCSNDR